MGDNINIIIDNLNGVSIVDEKEISICHSEEILHKGNVNEEIDDEDYGKFSETDTFVQEGNEQICKQSDISLMNKKFLEKDLIAINLTSSDTTKDNLQEPICFESDQSKGTSFIYKNKTGLIYDERMKDYWCTTEKSHPERPLRVVSIYKKLCDKKITQHCVLLKSRNATEEEILLKHSKKHYEVILSIKEMAKVQLDALTKDYDSIYFHENTTECSLLSAGCTIEIMEQVILGHILNGAAIVRPPGHHALAHCSMGFCHFNNVAIAAMVAITKYNLKRILIVDWDVHYGNGIHKMFEDDPRVLYFSTHRYDNNTFWPCLIEANYNAVGTNTGEGYNVHIAWNSGGMNDADYLCAFKKVLLPIAQEYKPELIIVSAGFDSGRSDPLGGCDVSPNGYALMTRYLMDLVKDKVIIVLEGGYNLKTISESMLSCVETLLGKIPLPTLESLKPCQCAIDSIKNTHAVHQKYWKSLQTVGFHDVEVEKQHKKCLKYFSSDEESIDLINY